MTEEIEDWLYGGPRLLRVREINVRSTAATGVPIDLISLEVWEGMFRLHFAISILRPQGDDNPLSGWRIDDGHGSTFEDTGSSSCGDDNRPRMYYCIHFEGMASQEATEVRLTHAGLGVDQVVPL